VSWFFGTFALCRKQAVIILASRRLLITGTLHPIRWAIAAVLLLPVGLAFSVMFAKYAGQSDLTRNLYRTLCYLFAAEVLLLIVTAAIGLVYEVRARSRDAKLYQPPGKLVDIGSHRLHLNCTGQGSPTVVLEHGHQASYLDWSLVQPELARFTRVCSYDRAGYGWSDSSTAPRVPSVITEELHTLLQAAGEAPPYILVGHSFGTFDVVMFAHKFPNEVAGIVLVDGLHPDAAPTFSWREKVWLRVMQFTMPFGLPRWRGWCGGAVPGIKQAITCRSSLYQAIYREWLMFPQSADEVRAIAGLGDIPLIVIARDPEGRSNSVAEMRWNRLQRQNLRLSTNSDFVIATNSGHDVPLAKPDIVVNAVRKLHTKTASSREPAGIPEIP
jgi:pimeloyl-ACP methyl ester carboxylesterase